MPNTPSLEGPNAKFERASQHLNLLQQEVETLVNPDLYVVSHEFDRELGKQVWKLDSDPPDIPMSVSLLMGDALYNFRCSLDHLVWQLVFLNGEVPSELNEFPIFSTLSKYERAKGSKRSILEGVSKAAITLIDECQPYNRGYRPLWALRILGNTDKHRHLYLGVASMLQARFVQPGEIEGQPFIHTGPITRGTELCVFPSLDREMYFRPTFDVAFRQSDPTVIGASLMETLRQIQFVVHRVLEDFVPLFRSTDMG